MRLENSPRYKKIWNDVEDGDFQQSKAADNLYFATLF